MGSKCECWLNNGMALGEVAYRLLKAIETCGSLSQAATATGMTYRTAWVVLSRFEKTIGLTLVRRKAGGIWGGGSRPTASGRTFIAHYEKFRTEASEAFEALFKKHFV